MSDAEDYRLVNRRLWDERAPVHAASDGYGLSRFADPTHLSDVVAFDRRRLGDLSGQRAVHLQCHIGTDTVSLARLGARVTGLDLSPASLAEARRLAADLGIDGEFVQGEVYDAVALLGAARFDLVYTGVGAICWLPDIRRWASVVSELLVPGGTLFLREAHPIIWSLDEARDDGVLAIEYPYFETPDALVYQESGTYVDSGAAVFEHGVSHTWNHGVGEILTALLDAGLSIRCFVEHDTVPWQALPGQMVAVGSEWRLRDRPERLPHSYTLQAVKAG